MQHYCINPCVLCVYLHMSDLLPLQRGGRRSNWCWRARPGCTLGLGCQPRAAGWGVHEPDTDLWAPGWQHSSAVPPLGLDSWSCQLTTAAGDKWVKIYWCVPKLQRQKQRLYQVIPRLLSDRVSPYWQYYYLPQIQIPLSSSALFFLMQM